MKNKTKRSLLLVILVLSIVMSAFAVGAANYQENESAERAVNLGCTFKGHTWGEWEEITAATCEAQGLKRRECSVCNKTEEQTIESLGGHEIVTLEGYDATCTEPGKTNGTHCWKCNTVFEAQADIPAKGHTVVEEVTKATIENAGSIVKTCTACSEVIENIAIPAIEESSIKLSSSKVTYNGSVRTPSVVVADKEGKTLVKDTDYVVTYASGRKMPGIYTIKVAFIGYYEGEKKLEFTIAPQATTGVKAKTITSSSITLEWSKTTGATGYRVYQYSSSKGEYVLKKSVTGTSYKVTDLKGSTTYKFKIRPYTKAADGTVILGEYSSVLSTKTKSAYSVKMSTSSATLYVGGTKTLKATPTPSSKTITWKSSDKSIATVSSSGQIKAIKKGTATITAYFKVGETTYKATCKVTVKNPSLKLDKTSATLSAGNTLTLKATTAPEDLKVTWKSSNTSVATVSSTGKITAKKAGTATITASISYKGTTYKKTCKITVNKAVTASANITKLINYINKNGSTNSDGNKYIKSLSKSSGVSYSYLITYDKKSDCLEFMLIVEATYELQGFTAVLDRSGTYVDFEFLAFDLDYYGDVEYAAKAVGSLKASEYEDEYDAYEYWDYNYYPSSMKSDITNEMYAGTELAMLKWDLMVYDAIGLWLKDLGFTNY